MLRGWTSAVTPDDARYYDLGALKLDCSVGERTGWLGVAMIDDTATDLPIVIQGYASDLVPSGRQWRSEDSIRLLWAMKGFHQADTFGGTSGAPVAATANPTTIIGIHTNGLHGPLPWSTYNAFTRITPERLSQIHAWIGAN
jgi:putative chitinase